MKRFIIYLILFGNTFCVIGQSNLGIKTVFPDSIQIEIDSEKQTYFFQSEAKVLNLNSGPHVIRLLFDSLRFIEKSIYLEDGVEHWFELKIDSLTPKFKFYNTFPIAQSDTITDSRLIVNLKDSVRDKNGIPIGTKKNQGTSSNTTHVHSTAYQYGMTNNSIIDSAIPTQSDSLKLQNSLLIANNIVNDSILKSDSSLKLSYAEIYSGKRGCNTPSSEFKAILALIAKEPFSKNRMAIVNSELQNECLSIAQFEDLLNMFDFDDHKFEIIMGLQKNIFDLDNIEKLALQFQLSRHKEKFITFFNLE